ncbi:PAS domain-containing protein [Mucilaginibacter rubeus]|uniref:PAS domain S-box protein n=1 Tax=Mucilaginibacter rubeus TaxID=2027860 RepID=A0A5C1I3C4_9SPHI|nr:PAS domain-containing protein [Mucilaginibacter rubeus]QEM12356.1 PAS domain S-box protein [Mucilaginibacter rubeus]
MDAGQYILKKWLIKYEQFVKGRLTPLTAEDESSIEYWKTQLFFTLLLYGLPISFVAAFPGIYLSIANRDITMGVVDITTFLGFAIITFSGRLALFARKLLLIGLFYPLAIYLIIAFGYIGPGIFYLFGLTVITTLILPVYFAYWSVLLSSAILISIAVLLPQGAGQYGPQQVTGSGSWVAFTSNLLFLSGIAVILIHRIIDRLGETLLNKQQLTQRYQMLFEKSPLPMWLFDTETLQFKDVNEAATRHYGYSHREFLNKKITDIRPAADNFALAETVQANRKSGIPYEQYARHYKKNGELIDVRIESSLLEVEGKLLRLVLATDITEIIRNEKEMAAANERTRRSESDLRAIFESTADGIVLIDEHNRVKQFNAKAADYIRFQQMPKQFEIGRDIFSYVSSLLHDDFAQLLLRSQSGETVQYDRQYRLSEAMMWVHYSLSPVYTDDKVTGVCITGRDITPVKTYVTKIEQQNDLFREIAWTQSHVVRAPIARLLGLLPLIRNPETDEDYQAALKYMEESITELDKIVSAVIHQSHRAGQMPKIVEKD